jgi:hypothetical protein
MKSISNEDYIKAKETIREYNDQDILSKKHICIICKEREIKSRNERFNPGMWKDGTVKKITFGYGSKHDMSSFYIAICDDCADSLIEVTDKVTFL